MENIFLHIKKQNKSIKIASQTCQDEGLEGLEVEGLEGLKVFEVLLDWFLRVPFKGYMGK